MALTYIKLASTIAEWTQFRGRTWKQLTLD